MFFFSFFFLNLQHQGYVSPMHSPAGPGFPNSPAQSFHSVTLRSQPGGHASRPSVGQYTRSLAGRRNGGFKPPGVWLRNGDPKQKNDVLPSGKLT